MLKFIELSTALQAHEKERMQNLWNSFVFQLLYHKIKMHHQTKWLRSFTNHFAFYQHHLFPLCKFWIRCISEFVSKSNCLGKSVNYKMSQCVKTVLSVQWNMIYFAYLSLVHCWRFNAVSRIACTILSRTYAHRSKEIVLTSFFFF